MTRSRKALGQYGEARAEEYLRNKNYTIVAKNKRFPQGELDLIAMDGETLVFVEVRTRSSDRYGTSAESITWRKQKKLRELAMCFLQDSDRYYPSFRFDVVLLSRIQVPTKADTFTITHITNAF